MPPEETQLVGSGSYETGHDPGLADHGPSAVATEDRPRSAPNRAERHRASVDALVERALAPAMGLCVRVFDPLGDDPQGREQARMIVMECIAGCAARGVTADDDGIRQVMGRLALAGLDGLVGHPGGARPPDGVDLGVIAAHPATADDVAPSGMLRHAVLQDATAPARRRDRQVAFVVLAAGVPPTDASVLLDMTPDAVEASLSRIMQRIAQSEGLDTVAVLP